MNGPLTWITKLAQTVTYYFKDFTGQSVFSKQENGLQLKVRKRVQNPFIRDLKTPNFTINLQLIFTNLVYMLSGASVKEM